MAKSKYSYNAEPRLSANQLAEIVNASPTRRKSIYVAAKFPKTAIVAQYRDAYDHLVTFLRDPNRTRPNFASQIAGLEGKSDDPSLSTWIRNDAGRSAEALSKVQSTYNATKLGGYDLRKLPNKKPKVVIAGVEISSSASCSVHGKYKGENAVGCLSIFMNKSETSTSARMERCRSAAVLSVLYAEQHLKKHGHAIPKMSLSYDVFMGRLVQAPNTYKQRLSNMTNACEDVALWWPEIEPPTDYDGPQI